MTKQELEAMFDIKKELNKHIQTLKVLNSKSLIGSSRFSGSPRHTTTQSSIERDVIRKEEAEAAVMELQRQALRQTIKVFKYIVTLNDSVIRQLIILRCVELKQWKVVAKEIGGRHTDSSLRAVYKRFIKELPES